MKAQFSYKEQVITMHLINHSTELYHEGFLPGPGENEILFMERINECRQTKDKLPEIFSEIDKIPLDNNRKVFEEMSPYLRQFDLPSPDWLPILFTNYQLPFWQGGCAWIYQMSDHTPTTAFLQLRASFHNHSHYLKIYKKSELIPHELVHVIRMMFNEPKFEEVLAYQTSPSPFRRYFGPLFQSSKESFFFLMTFLIAFFFNFFIFTSSSQALLIHLINTLPILVFLFFSVRLIIRQTQYRNCFSHLQTLFGAEAQKILYGLTDWEITQFSRWSNKQIKSYIETNTTFRWIFLKSLNQ